MDGPVDPSRVPSVEAREQLLTLVRGYRISQAIYVATRLGIPDLLADGPREIDELAHAARAGERWRRAAPLLRRGESPILIPRSRRRTRHCRFGPRPEET